MKAGGDCGMRIVVYALGALLVCAAVLLGCRPQDSTSDAVVEELRRIRPETKDPDARKRVATALSMRQNEVGDREPVLIVAGIVADKKGGGKTYLRMVVYDEDADVVGIGVREESNAVDGQEISFAEEYPVFAYDRFSGPLGYTLTPVDLRDSDQRKDEGLWRAYVEEEPNKTSVREPADSPKPPSVYVSIPEPNDLTVWIYVYDQAGHQSEPVRLLNAL